MFDQDTLKPETPQDPQLTDNPLYVRRAKRAKSDKPPEPNSAIGVAAASRFPGSSSRREMEEGIRAQNEGLVAGAFGIVWYKPVTVCGIEIKLEPLQPSIGTAVHGLDLARNLAEPSVVTFIRQLWLERKVVAFRGQEHLTR